MHRSTPHPVLRTTFSPTGEGRLRSNVASGKFVVDRAHPEFSERHVHFFQRHVYEAMVGER